jgi:hypothetical protein
MQDIRHRELAGKEVHSRRVMKEGARADRGNDAIGAPHCIRIPGIPADYSHFISETDVKGAPKKAKLRE